MLFIHLFTDFMKHDHNKKKKIVFLGRKEKVGACIFGIFFSPPWKERKSGSLHLWNLFFPLLGREEKVGACIFGIFFFPSLEGRKKWGSIRHRPPSHPPLIERFLSIGYKLATLW